MTQLSPDQLNHYRTKGERFALARTHFYWAERYDAHGCWRERDHHLSIAAAWESAVDAGEGIL